jgi:RNA polymerase sigma-70 factor (ECF subfamily)
MEPSVPLDARDWLVQNARALRVLARKLVHGDEAEDLVQDTLVRGLERPPEDEARRGSWLRVVCRNLFLTRRRRDEHRAARESRVASPATAPDTFDVVAHRSAVERLIGALHALSPEAYEVIQLRFYEELPPAAIAARLSLPLSTVKRRLERALQQLRERLGAQDEHERDWRQALAPLVSSREGSIGEPAVGATLALSKTAWLASAAVVVVASAWFLASATRSTESPSEAAAVKPVTVAAPSQGAPLARALLATPTDEEVAPPSRGSLSVTVTWPDGTPAARLPFFLMVYPDTEVPASDEVIAATDDDGEAVIEDLPVGHATVYLPDPRVSKGTRIEAGEEASLALKINGGMRVEGEVVTREGAPVPDAEVWLGDYAHSDLMTCTDHEGKFSLRDVCPGRELAARARDHAPSLAMRLEGKTGDVVHARLELSGPGGNVAGTVRDAHGEPVEGARVMLTPRVEPTYYQPWSSSPPRAVAFTDAEGKFECPGMSLGSVPLVVQARTSGTVERAGRGDRSHDDGRGATAKGRKSRRHGARRQRFRRSSVRRSRSSGTTARRTRGPAPTAATAWSGCRSASTRCALAPRAAGAARRRWSASPARRRAGMPCWTP